MDFNFTLYIQIACLTGQLYWLYQARKERKEARKILKQAIEYRDIIMDRLT